MGDGCRFQPLLLQGVGRYTKHLWNPMTGLSPDDFSLPRIEPKNSWIRSAPVGVVNKPLLTVGTVDGRKTAPVDMINIPLFTLL